MSAKNSFAKFRRRRVGFSGLATIFLMIFFLVQANSSTENSANLSEANQADFAGITEEKRENSEKSGANHDGRENPATKNEAKFAREVLQKLPQKGRAPKTNYSRKQFGDGWADWRNCDTRQKILARDLTEIQFAANGCTVLSGVLFDPYTGEKILFSRENPSAVQIDHVVALSNAWQTGAQNLSPEKRAQLANDDLELIAVDGKANQQKSDGDAATWLPKNKAFRCQYVARQLAVKEKYSLWLTPAEFAAIERVLSSCPGQRLPRE